jgi:hypothetical protein
MRKEKSEKTTQLDVIFPEGIHKIWFGPSEGHDTEWILGYINLISILTDDETTYVGAIHFHQDLKEVGDEPYPLAITFHPEDGAIHFHVQGATRKFNDNVDSQFRFIFNGTCEETSEGIVISGSGGVPQGFIPSGPPTEPGDPVSWTSRGPDERRPKHSK